MDILNLSPENLELLKVILLVLGITTLVMLLLSGSTSKLVWSGGERTKYEKYTLLQKRIFFFKRKKYILREDIGFFLGAKMIFDNDNDGEADTKEKWTVMIRYVSKTQEDITLLDKEAYRYALQQISLS